jgi:hypothetical protein
MEETEKAWSVGGKYSGFDFRQDNWPITLEPDPGCVPIRLVDSLFYTVRERRRKWHLTCLGSTWVNE